MFPSELEQSAFKASNGEYGWARDQVARVVEILVMRRLAILGGELWWVREGVPSWTGLIPQRYGPDAVYHWETERQPGEEWDAFVQRCAAHAIEAVRDLPGPDEIPVDLPGRILYNLTWVAEGEYDERSRREV